MSIASIAPLKFRGQSSRYVDIGLRGDEHLAVSVEYAVHPSNVGCFIVRFVAHGKTDPKAFKHLTYRESAQFLIPATGVTSAEVFNGLRLNKLAIPVSKPAIRPTEVGAFAEKHQVFDTLGEWIEAQALAENFALIVKVADALREQYAEPAPTPAESILELPDLTAPDQKAAALKLVKKPEPVEAEEDEDGESEDGDEDDKEWLN